MARFARKQSLLVALSTIVLGALLSAPAQATIILDNAADPYLDLYEIFNQVYDQNYTSSQQLFDERGVPEGNDWSWQRLGLPRCRPQVRAVFSYADGSNSLWYRDQVGATEILSAGQVPDYGYDYHPYQFGPDGWFEFVDKATGGEWSSQTTDNLDGLDHFVAIDATDLFGGPGRSIRRSYLIAFEDMYGLGDRGYNDLVAVVRCIEPIPEPATMLMLGLGSLGLAGLRRRRSA